MPPGVKERVTGVLLYRGDSVLLQLRDDKPDIRFPNTWAIFGGLVDEGEDVEAGARREIREELGLTLQGELQLIHVGEDEVRHRTYFAAPLTVDLEALTLNEGQGMALFDRAGFERIKAVPLHVEIIREWFASR